MSAIFITTSSGERYYFDAVFSVESTESGSPSEHPLSSGATVTDHYIHDGIQISISGAVSKVKFLKNTNISTDLNEFVVSMRALKRSAAFFTVGLGDVLGSFRNCQFLNFSMVHNEGTGRHSIDVSMSIKQTIVAQSGQITQTPTPAAAFNDMLSPAKVGASSTVEPPDQTKMNIQTQYNSLNQASGNILPTM